MTDLKKMDIEELKQYLSQYRRDNEKFSAALAELISREKNPTIYPADMSFEEVGRVFEEKTKEINKSKIAHLEELDDIYESYLKDSADFYINKLSKVDGRSELREFSSKDRVKVNQQFFNNLKGYVVESSNHKLALSQFLINLEASKEDLSCRADDLLNFRLVTGVFVTFISSFLTYFLLDLGIDKTGIAPTVAALVSSVALIVTIKLTQRIRKLKELISHTEAFIKTAKGVLEQDSD